MIFLSIVRTPVSPRRCSAQPPDLFEREPEGEGPGRHPQPAGQKAAVERTEPLVVHRLQQAVQGVLVNQTWNEESTMKTNFKLFHDADLPLIRVQLES